MYSYRRLRFPVWTTNGDDGDVFIALSLKGRRFRKDIFRESFELFGFNWCGGGWNIAESIAWNSMCRSETRHSFVLWLSPPSLGSVLFLWVHLETARYFLGILYLLSWILPGRDNRFQWGQWYSPAPPFYVGSRSSGLWGSVVLRRLGPMCNLNIHLTSDCQKAKKKRTRI